METPEIIFPTPTTGNPKLDVELETWGIKLGCPVEDINLARRGHSTYLEVSGFPHVFHSQLLVLTERGKELEFITSAMIMMGHGIALDADNENWYFLETSKRVSDTVNVYERIANQTGWPLVDALLVCRTSLKPEYPGYIDL
ncbi:MAG: hypothetical protein PHE48_03020 [Candidatus Daviesbacteria bacterium]|nr:hypothetical protein [Candidatus Daviesbacteria bacterium]